jgi:negative regulator of sigma E activity
MNSFNQDNIDEIMFKLLEGEIQGQERTKLLEAIQADPEYASIWAAWQKTIVAPNLELGMNNKNRLYKEKKIIPLFTRYAIAASLALLIGLGVVLFNRFNHQKIENKMTDNKPVKIKKDLIEPLKPNKLIAPLNEKEETDSFQNKKERLRGMASNPIFIEKDNSENLTLEQFIKTHVLPKIKIDSTPEILQKKFNIEETPIEFVEKTETQKDETVLVQVSNIQYESDKKIIDGNSNHTRKGLFRQLFGDVKLKIENDSTTFTNKKIIIENKKYQIIAGY